MSRSSRTPLRDARGAGTWVSFLMIVGTASAAYLGWVWAPLYLDHLTVRQAVRATMNMAIKNPDDALLVNDLCRKVRTIRAAKGVDDAGRRVALPAVALSDQQVTLLPAANATRSAV